MINREWTLRAACRNSGLDPDTWFPNPGDSHTRETALRICRNCPVQRECAELANRIGAPYGIWGGLRRNQFGQINGHQQRARA